MTKRRAIIRLVLVFLFIAAVLSYAAYTVQKQNDLNATNALLSAYAVPASTTPSQQTTPSNSVSVPVNEAINTDTTPVQYKTVSGNGIAFEAPLDWNSFTEKTNGCTIENIVNKNNAIIAIWPTTCSEPPHQYKTVTVTHGYTVATATANMTVYNHVISTFALIP